MNIGANNMLKKLALTVFVVSLVVMAFLPSFAPLVQAASKVTIRFSTSGLTSYNGAILKINGVTYTYSELAWKTFQWKPGDKYTIEALTPVTGWDNNIFRFSSWTNGYGLVGASGTFTVPNCDVNVKANYVKTTVSVAFAASGLDAYNGGTVLTIDGTEYGYWNLPSFLWESGTTHTVAATSSLTGYDGKVYGFSSWTNGNGLTDLSGTLTVPSTATTVTANYAVASVGVTFAASGLSNYDDLVLTIDDTEYTFWNLPSFLWVPGSTHTVIAATPLTGWDNHVHQFTSWTNGNGLTEASGMFTVPSSDTTVTANYDRTTVIITFASNGLSNYDGDVLTIDGTQYTFWTLPSFIWETGSTHAVAAISLVTGWDDVTHEFSSWTNGNGLTEASGTFTVQDSDTTVTANYADLSNAPAETTLTIFCSPSTLDRTNGETTTTISGTLTSGGSGVQGKTIALTYFDGFDWLSIGSITTDADGAYSYTWEVPASIENGQYALKAEFAGDSGYLASSATTDSCNGGGLLVLPEYLWGGLAALIASFGAAIVFFRIRKT